MLNKIAENPSDFYQATFQALLEQANTLGAGQMMMQLRNPDGSVLALALIAVGDTAQEVADVVETIDILDGIDPGPEARRKAPWPDWEGNDIYEGDTIRHPDGTTGKVVYWPDDSDHWRVDYGDSASRLCLQVGDKGQAVVVSEEANE